MRAASILTVHVWDVAFHGVAALAHRKSPSTHDCRHDTGILAGMLHLPAAAAAALSPASLAAGAHLDLSSMACLPPGLSTPPAFALHTRRTCARLLGVPNICGDVASLHISLVAAPSRLLAHTSRSMAAAASSTCLSPSRSLRRPTRVLP